MDNKSNKKFKAEKKTIFEVKNLHTEAVRLVYRNDASNYTVMVVKNTLNNNKYFLEDTIMICGSFKPAYPGEKVIISGNVNKHAKYGTQIEITSFEVDVKESTKESTVQFLTRSSIKGIDIKNALKIYDTFGLKTLDILLHDTSRIMEVKGIASKTLAMVKSSLEEFSSMEELNRFGINYGIPYTVIYKIFKLLGKDALSSLKKNVYSVLNYDECTLTFKQVDMIGSRLKVDKSSIERLTACLRYTLKNSVNLNSSTGIDVSEVAEAFFSNLDNSEFANFKKAAVVLIKEGTLIKEKGILYLADYYNAEKYISETLLDMVNAPVPSGSIKTSVLEEEINRLPFKLNAEQLKAVKICLSKSVSILTGEAGTGKSSVTKVIANTYVKSGFNVVLLSPTGKAAQRLAECAGMNASTVHKYLFSQQPVLDNTMFIVDEASMLDVVLFRDLLKRFRGNSRLVLVGDYRQLPSIQAGNVFEDVLFSSKVPVALLTDIMRQAKNSNIIRNCAYVNRRKRIVECNEHDFIYKTYKKAELVYKFLKEQYAKDMEQYSLNDIQILTPYKRGRLGLNMLNSFIKEEFNSNPSNKQTGFAINDKVVQTINNYSLKVFNGETGVVVSSEDSSVQVDFGDRTVTYGADETYDLTLANALTIHKAQGSEYPVVYVIIDDEIGDFLLLRKLLYTALSRGKKKVYLISMSDTPGSTMTGVEKCIFNNKQKERITKLKTFLENGDN